MGIRFGVLIAMAIVATANACSAQPAAPVTSFPPTPFEEIGACPFEGCVYREWTANDTVELRAERRSTAEVRFTLQKGERVQAITGVVVTVKPGRVQFRKPADVWTTAGPLHVEPGETLYLLTPHGEGAMTAWFKGRVYDAVDGSEFTNALCGNGVVCNGTIIDRPQTEWWIRVRNRKGMTGWTNEPQKFDNKDLHG